MPNILILGATRGLGASLANLYASKPNTTVFGTTRSSSPPTSTEKQKLSERIVWITEIDVSVDDIGTKLVQKLGTYGQGGAGNGGMVLDVVVSSPLPPPGKNRRGRC
jgi:NAD(P)-dependent dehydrogenase (short-subunit alcohol dehydrogenase family)